MYCLQALNPCRYRLENCANLRDGKEEPWQIIFAMPGNNIGDFAHSKTLQKDHSYLSQSATKETFAQDWL